jgi:hypothetical protein
LSEADFLQAIAGSLDDLNIDGVVLCPKESGNVIRLPKSQLRAAAADAEIHLPPTALA